MRFFKNIKNKKQDKEVKQVLLKSVNGRYVLRLAELYNRQEVKNGKENK